MDELYSSSKWLFLQANIKIHLVLVYWDARNSLSYNLVIPFKDGTTFVVTTAIQSLQQCYLESVADLSYGAVDLCHFWTKFSKKESFFPQRWQFWIKVHHFEQKLVLFENTPVFGQKEPILA